MAHQSVSVSPCPIDKSILRRSYGFVGLGGCGSNIAKQFMDRGYPTVYINSSEGDLASIDAAPDLKYHLTGGAGTAQDRQRSRKLFKESLERVRTVVASVIGDVDVLFLCSSCGGGTGSGAVPVLAKYFETIGYHVCTIGVLPADSESYQIKANAYDYCCELEQLHTGASILVDNHGQRNIMSVNERLAYDLDTLLTHDGYSQRGYVDQAEIHQLLTTPGMLRISVLSPNQQGLQMLRESLNNNIYAPLVGDKVVRYVALIQTESGDIQIDDIHAMVGRPISDYIGYGAPKCILALAGCTMPYTRIDHMHDLAAAEGAQILANIQAAGQHRYQTRTVIDFNTSPKEPSAPASELDWFFGGIQL